MSYCHNLAGGNNNVAMTFGQGHTCGDLPSRVANKMRGNAAAKAAAYPQVGGRRGWGCLAGRGPTLPPPRLTAATHSHVSAVLCGQRCAVAAVAATGAVAAAGGQPCRELGNPDLHHKPALCGIYPQREVLGSRVASWGMPGRR